MTFDEAEIRAAERKLVEALEAPDPTAWVYVYTEDAMFVAPGAPALEGRDALLEFARAIKPLSSVAITPLRTEGNGPLAYVYGKASWVSGRPPETSQTTRVRLVIVWRKEADGVWRVAHEFLNAAEPDA